MWKNRPSFSYFTRIWWRMGCRKCINIKTLDWAVRCSVCEMKTKKTLKHFSVNSRFQELLLLSTSIHFLILFPVGVTIVQKNSKKFCNILFNISSVIRQKGESRTCAYLEGKKCSFFEKFGVLCFPFWDSPFRVITDDLHYFNTLSFNKFPCLLFFFLSYLFLIKVDLRIISWSP